MRKLKFKLDRKSLEIIYTTFIRPLLEYGDVIWDNCTQYEKLELEKIQNEAARIATGTTKLVSLNSLYNEICWETLETRLNNHKMTLFYKMVKKTLHLYTYRLLYHSLSVICLAIIFEILMTYKLWMLELTSTILLFCHQVFEHGMICLMKQSSVNL